MVVTGRAGGVGRDRGGLAMRWRAVVGGVVAAVVGGRCGGETRRDRQGEHGQHE
jgi:hypothetical protein